MASTKDATLQQEVNDLNKFLVKLVERRNGQIASQDWSSIEGNVAIPRDIMQFVKVRALSEMLEYTIGVAVQFSRILTGLKFLLS